MNTQLTEQQIAMLRRTASGVVRHTLTPEESEVLRYLADEGLCSPRVDLLDGLYRITQTGKALLESHDQEHQDRAAQEAQTLHKEVQRIQERKQDRRDKWLLGILSACGGSILTFGLDHIQVLAVFLRKLFQR